MSTLQTKSAEARNPRGANCILSGRTLRRVVILAAVILGAILLTNATVTRIDAAHVGIKVNLAGSSRGVQDIPIVSGWVFFDPLTEQVVSFPTSVQNLVWTKSPDEGRPIDESITFSSQEGVNVNADIGLSFHIDAAKAPHLYPRFRQNDLLLLADGYERNAVREGFNDEASHMPVQEIYGAGKGRLVAGVMKQLAGVLGKDGFLIDQLTAARQRAAGEADAVLIRAHAEAKANQVIRLSTTATVLQYRAIERWNGRLPMMQAGPKRRSSLSTSPTWA